MPLVECDYAYGKYTKKVRRGLLTTDFWLEDYNKTFENIMKCRFHHRCLASPELSSRTAHGNRSTRNFYLKSEQITTVVVIKPHTKVVQIDNRYMQHFIQMKKKTNSATLPVGFRITSDAKEISHAGPILSNIVKYARNTVAWHKLGQCHRAICAIPEIHLSIFNLLSVSKSYETKKKQYIVFRFCAIVSKFVTATWKRPN